MLLLAALAGLALVSIAASEMPRIAAWPLAGAVLAWGAWRIRHEGRKPVREFVLPAGATPASVDGRPVGDFHVEWRGGLAFAQWRGADGRLARAHWWPDTLPAAARRELRLAADRMNATNASSKPGSMPE